MLAVLRFPLTGSSGALVSGFPFSHLPPMIGFACALGGRVSRQARRSGESGCLDDQRVASSERAIGDACQSYAHTSTFVQVSCYAVSAFVSIIPRNHMKLARAQDVSRSRSMLLKRLGKYMSEHSHAKPYTLSATDTGSFN